MIAIALTGLGVFALTATTIFHLYRVYDETQEAIDASED